MTVRPTARDLLVAPRYEGDSWGSLDLVARDRVTRSDVQADLDVSGSQVGGVDVEGRSIADLSVAHGPDALRQALLLRLLTPLGSLTPLGHAGYGSRLHELIGELNVPTTRQLARSYTLRALREDPRVENVLEVTVVEPDQFSLDHIELHVVVEAADITDPIALGIEVAL